MGPTGETTATTSTLSITWNRTTIQTTYVKYHRKLPYWYGCQNAVNGSQPLPPSMFQPSLFKLFQLSCSTPLCSLIHFGCSCTTFLPTCGRFFCYWTDNMDRSHIHCCGFFSISLSEKGPGLDVLSVRVLLQVQQGLHSQTLSVGEIIVDSIRLVIALHLHLPPGLHNHHIHNIHGMSLERTRHHTAITTT